MVEETFLAASILLSSINPIPAAAVASDINFALSLSPSALITAARLSSSAFATTNLDLSASCCATCFCSTAFENSAPYDKCLISVELRHNRLQNLVSNRRKDLFVILKP
ncbi:hypothetical protein HanXRQr2_Chr15g0709371 [Helianthus annuus]|uniref:Uncharacterized protein n=1 Tax=Helianthus annuus TaxID=4232 RepID=A0A9K3E2L6_HELAN|nr:hypothetical protein HanXRQr2_Chr15g0709371 [Helianthus annuus]